MSRFSGKQGKGALRQLREDRMHEAYVRTQDTCEAIGCNCGGAEQMLSRAYREQRQARTRTEARETVAESTTTPKPKRQKEPR